MVKILDHPLIKIKLTTMRDVNTTYILFRQNLSEVASLMLYEILRDYQGKVKTVTTPTQTTAKGLDFDREIVIVPILRAGLGMVEAIWRLLPQARIGHIGLYRDENTFKAKEYFYKMPNVDVNSEIIVVDPMLATGNSAVDAITKLKNSGFKNISLVSIVGVQEGIDNVLNHHPETKIFLAAQDDYLNEDKYIIPGLGDAGDRLFGTK